MKKLTLALESLAVESFVVDGTDPRAGTVHGQADPYGSGDPETCGGSGHLYCISVAPCVPSNEQTCVHSCWGTCADQLTCGGWTCGYTVCQRECGVIA